VSKKGKTPVLDGDEARKLLESIDTSTVVGLRDRALIALLIYSFARISAALHMNVKDYYPQGKRWWVRLHEKGGKEHEMPAHHLLETYFDAYVTAADMGTEKTFPLFRTLGGHGCKQLGGKRMSRQDARRTIVRLTLCWTRKSPRYHGRGASFHPGLGCGPDDAVIRAGMLRARQRSVKPPRVSRRVSERGGLEAFEFGRCWRSS
jgi:Phage integrase family